MPNAEITSYKSSKLMTIPNDIVIILNGTSSSGKSSIAKQIQAQLKQPMIHAQIDHFLALFNFDNFKTGCESLEAVKTSFSLFQNSIESMCKTKYPILIDTVFERAEYFQGTINAIHNRNTFLIGVHCSINELSIREKNRGDRRIGLASEQFNLVHENMNYDYEVDSSMHSSEECSTKIIKFINYRLSVNSYN
jgi:chloramphenicol 3-O phosphotransferase